MASERQEAWNSRMVHEKCLPGVYPSISPDVQRVKIGRPPGIRFECFSFLPKAGETSVVRPDGCHKPLKTRKSTVLSWRVWVTLGLPTTFHDLLYSETPVSQMYHSFLHVSRVCK